MASLAATRIPYEIVSDILTPLFKHPDEVFSDHSAKPLLTLATHLVCRAWLRLSTPLLYSVVILRTTAQVQALQTVLESNEELGLFIRKLRIEGGFGNTMHSILKSAPDITDLFFTLGIWGSDSVRGLCAGLPLVNPQRAIVLDGVIDEFGHKPKKNKKVTQLFETLLGIIPKWDKLVRYRFGLFLNSGPH
ncbi:hypothetical protein B0H13DRAFT_1608047 [Mycena leptocephala]|nr:hypothetical protein B0H13DRAFT_1608047 [Mycena leptocephala]